MVKKILFTSLALSGLLFSTMPPACFADAAAQLKQAETYKQNEQYEQAEAIYRDIVADYPGTDEAFQAQKSLALLYIKTARYPAARQEVDALLTNFAGHPELPAEVYKIAEQYRRRKRYEDARSLYEYIGENHSDSDLAIKARAWAAGADILLGNYAAAQAGIDGLIADFADHPELPGEVYKIAEQYRSRKRYENAKSLYKYIAENHFGSDFAIKARSSVVVADILLGNDSAAKAGIDGLTADFADHPELPSEVYKIEAQYWHMKRYEDVKRLCEYIAENHPDSDFAIKARASAAAADILLGNNAEAQAGVDALIRDFAEDPELAGLLWKLGNISSERRKYDWSRQLYQHTLETDPQGPLAIQARRSVVVADILLGNDEAAQAGIDGLIADFNDNPKLPGEIYKIEAQYWHMERYEEVKRLCEYIAKNHPDSDFAIKARASVAGADLLLGNDAAAQAGVDALTRDFTEDPELAGLLWKLGNISCEGGKYDWARQLYQRARQLYQRIVETWPDSNDVIVMKSRVEKIRADIKLGDDANVPADINELISDYNDNPAFPELVFVIGEQYYNKALSYKKNNLEPEMKENFEKTIAVWERVITDLPKSAAYTPRFYFISAVIYSQELNEYLKGIDYYQKVVDNWPSYEFAWNAQYFVGMYYEKLRNSGGIPKTEAAPKIEQAYQAVLEKYPESKSAPSAALKLGHLNLKRGQRAEAVIYYEIFLATASPNDPRKESVEARLEELKE